MEFYRNLPGLELLGSGRGRLRRRRAPLQSEIGAVRKRHQRVLSEEGSASVEGITAALGLPLWRVGSFDILSSSIFTRCIRAISYKSSINSRCNPGFASLLGLAMRSTKRVKAPSLFINSNVSSLPFASDRRKVAATWRILGSSS
jgi:hypothetical protein